MTTFPSHTVLPGIDTRVMMPRSADTFQKVPWLNITSGIMSINPDANRDTAAVLRLMADELDQAWAAVDRRAELSAQPEDDTAFTNLEAGLPGFAPHTED